jgi:hypothetical protein
VRDLALFRVACEQTQKSFLKRDQRGKVMKGRGAILLTVHKAVASLLAMARTIFNPSARRQYSL